MIPTDILNYRIVRHLGSGGMGSVYLAVNTNIDQQVAIKALRPEVAKNAALRARFKQEAEMLCSLDHPGIVKFLNYVETAEGVFLIMEYVKGMTLEDFINKKNGLIVESKAYPLICEILDAFAYAHSKGIVHRDIKPANIIIQDDGHIKIMDFGIAQIVSEANVTDSKSIMGTPAYMSPEQIYGKDIDARSDIYSIGVLIHNMLTGRAPYDSTLLTAQEIKRRIVRDNMPRMAESYPYISEKIQSVVDKATQKVPEARYQSCLEMKSAVKKAIAPDPISKPLLYGGITATIVLLLIGFFTWDYYRTKVEYYKDYVEVFGVPHGIGSLSKSDMSHREASYRFEYSRHKLRRVSYVNSLGNLVDHHDSEDKDRIVDMTLTYTEGTGKVDTEKFRNRSGKVLYVKDYDSNFKTCTFKLDDELGTEMVLNAQVELFQSAFDNSLEGKGKISKYILEYNEDGYLTKVEYAGFGNARVPDGQGIFGKSFVLDKEGRVIEEHYLGKDGKPKATQFGLGIKKFTYDEDDNIVQLTYLTVDGKPSSDGNNCPIVKLTYDEWGNRIGEKYYDMKDNSMIRKDNPFAGVVYDYNEDGFCTKQRFLGVDGGLTYVQGVNGYVNSYDENGYLKSRSYIDAKGNAAYFTEETDDVLKPSYSKMEFVNDEHGNPLDVKFMNATGKLSESVAYAHKTCTYDSLGNQLTEFYLDNNGKIYAPAQYGYAGIEITYNPQGRISRVTYMDANKKRLTLPNTHICYLQREYDARGNKTKEAYFDDKDQPTMSNEGIAMACYEYDENGNEITRSFYNTKGKPCVLNGFCARWEFMYDEQGNCISYRYKNTDGKLMLVNGIAGYNWSFDARGNKQKVYPIGLNGGLASGKYDERLKYDERDNVIERSYFNAGGTPVSCEGGYHKVLMKYNSNNQCIQEEYYGTNSLLTNIKNENYAVVKREFDERGNKTSEMFFTQTGTRGNDHAKVHKYYNQYDKIVNKIKHQLSFGSDGKPVAANDIAAEGRVEYDKRGYMTKLICYDGYGKKTTGLHGWSEQRLTYDEAGLKTSESFYSLSGTPAIDKEMKYHKLVYAYNSMRLLSSMTYLGANGKPIVVTGGYSTIKFKYNSQNQCVERSYYGSNGSRINNTSGFCREVYTYRDGTEYKCDLYDVTGKKVATAIRTNGKWNVQGMGQNNLSQGIDWKSFWRQSAAQCPLKLADGVSVEKITISGNIVMLDLILTNYSADQVTDEMIEALVKVKDLLRKTSKMPSNTTLRINAYDQYREKITTL